MVISRWGFRSLLVFIFLIILAGCDQSAPQRKSKPTHKFEGEIVYRGIFFGEGPVADKIPEIWGNVEPVPTGERKMTKEKASRLLSEHFVDVDERKAMRIAGDREKVRPEKVEEAVNSIRRRIIERIRNTDANFFRRFGEMVKSGNHIEVRKAMREAGERTLTASAAVLGQSKAALVGKEKMELAEVGTGQGKCITTFAAFAVAVTAAGAVNTVGAINLTIAGNYTFAYDTAAVYENSVIWGPDEEPQDRSSVHREMQIDLIKRRLSVG